MKTIHKFAGIFFTALIISSCNMKAKAVENDNPSLDEEYSLMNVGGEDVTWVKDIPVDPEKLVGRVVFLKNIDKPLAFTISANLPVKEKNDSVITRSIIKQAGGAGTIGLGGIFSIAASAETAIEFQVVQGSRWVTDTSSEEYYQGLKKFLSRAGYINQYDEVYMVQGVIKRKIWLKKYNKTNAKAELTYFVKVGGELYGTNSDYQEVSQYGVLYIPLILKKYDIDITRLNLSTESEISARDKVDIFTENAIGIKLPRATLDKLPTTFHALDEKSSFTPHNNIFTNTKNEGMKILGNKMLESKIKEYDENVIKIYEQK